MKSGNVFDPEGLGSDGEYDGEYLPCLSTHVLVGLRSCDEPGRRQLVLAKHAKMVANST